MEAALYDLAVQHAAFPISPANADKVATRAATCGKDLIGNPIGEDLTEALLLAGLFLPLIPDEGTYRQIAQLAIKSCQDNTTFQARISRVAATCMLAGAMLDDDKQFFEHNAALLLPPTEELNALEAEISASTKLDSAQKAGCHGIILRCRTWVALQKCVATCYNARLAKEAEATLLSIVDMARAEFTNESKALNARRNAILGPTSPMTAWLDLENSAFDLILAGIALQFSLGDGFSPQYFHDVTTHKVGSEQLQAFVAYHGTVQTEAVECVLASASNLPAKDTLYPTTLTFAYVLRGVIMALEIHATSFKLWRLPPAREPIWSLLLRAVEDTIRRLKGGGGGLAARITVGTLGAARETIRRWKGELVNRPYNPNLTPRPILTPDGTATITMPSSAVPSPSASLPSPHRFDSAGPRNGVINGEMQGAAYDPLVSSFAEWIAGIDWNQFVVPEERPNLYP